ncbi:MAG: glycosyltransferase family 2 protein [candidate division WOR-3 bacterium]
MVSIIFVNFWTSKYIKKLLKKLKNENFEIIVWNNSKEDEIFDDGIKVINSPYNIGFGPAVNRAVKLTSFNYILLINPDCDFQVDVIYELYKFLSNNEKVFAVSPKIISNNKIWPSARRIKNPFLLFFGRRSIFRFSKLSKKFLYLDESDKIVEVEGLIGTFLMFKKDIFLKLGGFDEKFFFYAEDLDLSLRAYKSGYKLFLLNYLVVEHSVGITRKIKNSFAEFKRAKSLFLFMIKNYFIFKLVFPLILLGFLYYALILMIRDLFDFKVKDIDFANHSQ